MLFGLLEFVLANIILSIALVFVGGILLLVGYELLRTRPDKLRESYPFENTVRVLVNYDTINDFFVAEFKSNPETYSVNMFVSDCDVSCWLNI